MTEPLLDRRGRPLDLTPEAEAVARNLQERFGEMVVFSSGRRGRVEQARAMAHNVVRGGRQWIAATYRPSAPSLALQKWVDMHPAVTDVSRLTSGFAAVLARFGAAELATLSKHFTGDAFDLEPVPEPSGAVLHAYLSTHPGIRFLDHEGGLVRWHVQVIREAS